MKITKLEHVVENLASVVDQWNAGGMDMLNLRNEFRQLARAADKCSVRKDREAAKSAMVSTLDWFADTISAHVEDEQASRFQA